MPWKNDTWECPLCRKRHVLGFDEKPDLTEKFAYFCPETRIRVIVQKYTLGWLPFDEADHHSDDVVKPFLVKSLEPRR